MPANPPDPRIPERLKHHPNLAALYVAVWQGDLCLFPESVREFYLVTGTLAVLALSGQHVWILFSLLSILSRVFLSGIYRRKPAWLRDANRETGLLLCSLILLITSGGNASMVRTFSLCFSFFILNSGSRVAGKIQCLTTATALLVLWEPRWFFQIGFVLSFFGVFLVFVFEGHLRWAPILFPILMLPLLAHFFGRVPLLASLVGIPIEFVWTGFLIPLGFILPAIPFLDSIEKLVGMFYGFHTWTSAATSDMMPRVFVPNLYEVILLEIWGVGGALFLLQARKRDIDFRRCSRDNKRGITPCLD